MTLLQALNWMNESENNVAVNNDTKYKVKDGKIMMLAFDDWAPVFVSVNNLHNALWEKDKSVPGEVEVVAYIDKTDGEIRFCRIGSAIENEYKESDRWCKAKVRLT